MVFRKYALHLSEPESEFIRERMTRANGPNFDYIESVSGPSVNMAYNYAPHTVFETTYKP